MSKNNLTKLMQFNKAKTFAKIIKFSASLTLFKSIGNCKLKLSQ